MGVEQVGEGGRVTTLPSHLSTLRVTTGRPGHPLDGLVTIVAEDSNGERPWSVALMDLPDPAVSLAYAQRLVRCYEACRGVSDETLEAWVHERAERGEV